MSPLEFAEAFTARVVLPALRGGELKPLAPLGPRRALELQAAFAEVRRFGQVQQLRLHAARRVYPVDSLPDELSEAECLLLVALNDMLQLTNPSLSRGVRSSENQRKLMDVVSQLIERAGPPRTLAEVLSRHSLFHGVARIVRHDTRVTWWSGTRDYVGERPPARLLAWPRARRVRTTVQRVRLAEMGQEVPGFNLLRERWFAASPLTLFDGLGAGVLAFQWTGTTLSLVSFAPGRSLAVRAILAGAQAKQALEHLRLSREELRQHHEGHRLVDDFLRELVHRKHQLDAVGASADA